MKKLSPVLVFAAGSLWGLMGLFVRPLVARGMSSSQVAGVRSILTAVIFALVLLVFDRSLFRIKLRDLWCFAGSGIMSITFFNCCYFYCMGETSLSVAAILLYTAPIFVVLMSAVFFGEKLTLRKFAALGLCFSGCVLVSGIFSNEGGVSAAGILAGLGSGVGYALYSVFSRAAINRGYRTMTILFYTFVMSSAASLAVIDFSPVVSMISDGSFMWGTVMLLTLIATVAPYLLYTVGLSGMENGPASIIASVEPVVATAAGFVFFSEVPDLPSVPGMVLVLSAVVILNLEKKSATAQIHTHSARAVPSSGKGSDSI